MAANEELSAAAAELALHRESHSRAGSEVVSCAGLRANFRWNVLHGVARLRRRILGVRSMPRMREYANLVWLSERLFQTPRPLAAGVSTRGGLPCFQFIVCEEITETVTLDAFLSMAGRAADSGTALGAQLTVAASEPIRVPAERTRVLTELARELARMHALRFVHGDLTPERILVGPASHASRIHFRDPSRGGPRLSTRGSLDELAHLVARVRHVLTESEILGFVATYVDERRAQGRAIDAGRLTHEIEKRLETLGR